MDCCFGGSFGVDRNITVPNLTEMTQKVVSELDIKKSRMVLSSGGLELVSDGLVADFNSPFTKPLIEFLKENKEAQIVFSEVFNLLRKKPTGTPTKCHNIKCYNILDTMMVN